MFLSTLRFGTAVKATVAFCFLLQLNSLVLVQNVHSQENPPPSELEEIISSDLAPVQTSITERESKGKLESFYKAADATRPNLTTQKRPIQEVVANVLPSVVLIRTPTSNGSGCVMDSEGWILTNEHVIAGAPWDVETGTQVVRVYFGHYKTDEFELIEEPVWAIVYKVDRRADLALLRCLSMPNLANKLKPFELSDLEPKKGSDCLAIGMPAASVLWSVRNGTIAGHGVFPKDLQSKIRLGESEGIIKKRQEELFRYLAPDGDQKVTVSTCGINPGDSGGPLIDVNGRLIAVTYAIPTETKFKEFGYHVHLDEIRVFLNDNNWPAEPQSQPPSSLPRYETIALNFDEQKFPFYRAKLTKSKDPFVATYFDIDGEPVARMDASQATKLTEVEFWDQLGVEWCVTWAPTPTYFFDCDRDGKYELVFIVADTDGDEVLKFEKRKEEWKVTRATPDFLNENADQIVFDRVEFQKRFQVMRHRLLPSILRR